MSKPEEKAKTARVKLPCAGRRILVVDDEKTIRALFMQIIAYGFPNCRVDMAVNGVEAVEAFRQGRASVLVMDLRMPIMDGEQAYLEIMKMCEAENWAMPAVIFCTGYYPSDRLQSLIRGNSSHCVLRKPITSDQLMAAIRIRLPPETAT